MTFRVTCTCLRKLSQWVGAVSGIGLLVLAWGCPSGETPSDGGDGNANDNGAAASAEIVSFRSSFGLSALEAPVSVIYNVITEDEDAQVSGFYVPVADASQSAAPIGDRMITHVNLPIGQSQAFFFDPQAAGVGNYRVGIIVIIGEKEGVAESEGVIQVQGPPNPRFIQPVNPITEVSPGADVPISFDAGDPEGIVQWRLFSLAEEDSRGVPPDELGTQLLIGSGNVGNFNFSTAGLSGGDYEIGLSATDSGFSVSTTVDNGDLDRIVTIPQISDVPGEGVSGPIIRISEERLALPPEIEIVTPGSADVELFGDQVFTIEFTATVLEPGASGLVDVFYDDDTNPENRIFPIEVDLPASAASVDLDTNVIENEGAYYIGATIRDGINPRVTRYAGGQIILIREALLDVIEPSTGYSLPPSSPGETPVTAPVSWTTNVPASEGLVDVFARTINESGLPYGPEISILEPTSINVTTAEFSYDIPGLYEIFVRITFNNPALPTLTRSAPERVRISSLPTVLWLGSLDNLNPPFDGAIFEGVNFEDNAGTSFAAVDDLNGDGHDEFVIAARYGKPFFLNPSGVGPGEAYLIYGTPTRLRGAINLNSVGTEALVGVILTGIPTFGNTDETDGLSDVTLIPDADGDGTGDLVFGFPNTDSVGPGGCPLCGAGQFLNGGVVILSSDNSILRNPEQGTPVIRLNEVGQLFSSYEIEPGDAELVLADRLTYDEDTGTCVPGTDGIDDTVVGPSVGFIPLLAPPLYEQLGFQIISPGTPAAEGVCVTEFEVIPCVGPAPGNEDPFGPDAPGSGFYDSDATSLEPRGARIIGRSAGDRFGTSITSSNPLGDDSPGDLIISAPGRTARTDEFDVNVISSDIVDSGVAFLAPNQALWASDGGGDLPSPYQYVMRATSHCGDGRQPQVGRLSIAGAAYDQIRNVIGIEDFNGDDRNDFAVGAPGANGGQGRVYVAFRRETAIEGGYVLDKLGLDPTNPERLTGVLIVTYTADALGSSLASGVDFNGDGHLDLVIGSPGAQGGVGEVIVVFGDPNFVSPQGGIEVWELLITRNTDGFPRAARITGNILDSDGAFGFNVANAGDLDNDGFNDLLIAAPNASPRYDQNPTDSDDVMLAVGVDVDFDGINDAEDDLSNAGLVYVISGRNRLDQITPDPLTSEISISIDQLGTSQLRGYMIAGRRAGDRIGGGDAGAVTQGGKPEKFGRGRSFGLASAGDFDGDGRDDILIGSILADPRIDPNTGVGIQNGGEAYLVYSTVSP